MNLKPINLFPYQIKALSRFYHRNHPVNIPPKSITYANYWEEQRKRCIEGLWVNDKGTWVFMTPKLYFYINYTLIVDEERNRFSPSLRDIEWIIFTYILCVDGFSGFEFDDEYTCIEIVDSISKNKKLDEIELASIPPSAYNSEGKLKKYINAWDYLTNHYLLDKPASQPLGRALYENQRSNAMILSSRGIGKSMCVFVGDFLHEFLLGGIRSIDELNKINNELLFGMGSGDSRQLQRSLNAISGFYYNQPGKYFYSDPKEKPVMGSFYKRIQGSFEIGKEVQHVLKSRANEKVLLGATVQMVALTSDKTKIGAGDRFRRVYVEEVGFLSNVLEVHRANKDSLKVGRKRVGSAYYIGTGGDLKAIQQPKMMAENPASYDIFGIPNYWKNPNKKIALFIPWYYADDKYKDSNGNTKIELSFAKCLSDRAELKTKLDSASYDSELSFNPLHPDELLRPGSKSRLPRQQAADQLSKIDTYDIFKRRAIIGKLSYDPLEKTGVRFDVDLNDSLKPILEYKVSDDDIGIDKEGAFIAFEYPPEFIPEGLYWLIYDPAKQSGDGPSYHSVIVYKFFHSGQEGGMYDCIVAEWIGRYEKLDDNYDMVIKIAKFFNAKIFPEINVAGFVEYCSRKRYWSMLEGDAYLLEQEINPNGKRSYYKVGFIMNERKKNWCIDKLASWLLEVKEVDSITSLPRSITMDWILSKRILNEIINYDPEYGNYDHISSLLGLMLLIGKLGDTPIDTDQNEDIYNTDDVDIVYSGNTMQRCKFLTI